MCNRAVGQAKRIVPLNGFQIEYQGKVTGQVNFVIEFDHKPELVVSDEIGETLWLSRDDILSVLETDRMHSPGELAGVVHYLRNWSS